MPTQKAGAVLHAAGAAASIVSFITWTLQRFVFAGSEVPPEVAGLVFLTVPYALGAAGAWLARRRRIRDARDAAYLRSLKAVQVPRQDPPQGPPIGPPAA